MTRLSQRLGKEAEARVVGLAGTLGNARYATFSEDYAGKTDVVVNGRPIQVSITLKSRRQRKRLEALGIVNIPAGDTISDQSILTMIKSLLGLK